jgi:hypothetical protein
MRIVPFFSCVILLAGCKSTDNIDPDYTFQENYSYSELVALHYSQSASTKGYKYESKALVTEHNKHWPPLAKKCRAMLTDEGKDTFEFVFVLDSKGNVIDSRSPISGKAAYCFLNGIKEIKYPSPPFEYWYELVTVK